MIDRLSPNRMNLLNLRSRIATAERSAEILDDKRSALVKELLQTYREIIADRSKMREKMQEAGGDLFRALAIEGEEGVRSASFAAMREVSVDVIEENVWGVRFPQIRHESMLRKLDARGYSFITVSSTVDSAARRFEILLDILLQSASAEVHMKSLGLEVRKTSRRINAIREKLIPGNMEQLRYIDQTLEEREREDLVRLKKMKKRSQDVLSNQT